MTDTTREQVAKIMERHRRCFEPDNGPAFCSCNEWWYPHKTNDLEWHEHAAEQLIQALGLTEESVPMIPPRHLRHPVRLVTPWVSVEEEQ